MIKQVQIQEIDRVMEIVDDAKKLLGTYSTQWQQGYPNISSFTNDINNNRLYGYYDEDKLVGVIALVEGFNPDYEMIVGKWDYISGDNDITIHRICVKKEYYHQKIGDKLFKFAIEYSKEHNYNSIKVDTFSINMPLQSLAKNNNFIYKGLIYIIRPEILRERVAFEYKLK